VTRRQWLAGDTAPPNKCTAPVSWYHYQYYFDRIGFRIRHLKFDETTIDEEFYTRFEDILGRYPRWDLTKDFFLAVLEKPA
jgi:hypothetical protein